MVHSRVEIRTESIDGPGWRRPAVLPDLPLVDESHVAAWRRYEREAKVRGVVATLRDRLVQLQFPITAGISGTSAYRQATRCGIPPVLPAQVPAGFNRPEGLEILLHRCWAGTLPVIRAHDRSDFETLVRALTGHSEPVLVPPAMGACLVKDLNNWDRIRQYRRDWEQEQGATADAASWPAQFAMLSGQKELYQDRFLLLAVGEYSGVPAADVGLERDDWVERSSELRLAHEATHYLVLRLFGRFPSRVLDELVADLVGLIRAFGHYSTDLALRFLGLEDYPAYRHGGRLETYCRHSVGSGAFEELTGMTRAATLEIGNLLAGLGAFDEKTLVKLVIDLTASSLEHLAAGRFRRFEAGLGGS